MNNQNCSIDVMGRQRRWEQEGVAIKKFLEAAEHIKSMDEELNHHNVQLQSQTDQLKAHNENFRALNRQFEQESIDRKEGDRSGRRFTIWSVIIGCLLTYILDHIMEIYNFFTSPTP